MRIDLTGQVRVEDGERVLDESALPGRQGRLVLACLALRGEPVHRDVLADLLWPDGVPATWERTLSGVISRLRSGFAAAGLDDLSIANAFGCYELQRPVDAVLDIEVAVDAATDAERALAVGDLARASAAASAAATIARRPLLSGEEAEWIEAARTELRSALVRALDVQAAAAIGTSEAVIAASEAIENEPYRETSHVLLMRAHAALGNVAEALLAYERCRTLLADELGIDPSPETQALHTALLRADEESFIESLMAQGLLTLPQTATSFVGRGSELAAALELLSGERLVTLVGPGGVGKTRLAIEAARSAIGTFPDGVHLVDLTAVDPTYPLAAHVASTLGLRGVATAESVAAVLGSQKVLLLLDNCEHVLESCSTFVRGLLDGTESAVILATSREPLRLEMEAVREVPSLDLPGAADVLHEAMRSEAVELFAHRARSVRPDFELTPANAGTIAHICRRLDGIPLAIELAASRAATNGVTEIAERLDERLDPLAAAGRLPRHRTVQAAIDWSYDLLNRSQAETLRLVSIFEGPFTVDDARAVCDRDVDADVSALCERSLVAREDGTRVRLLETIKAYARERGASTDEWAAARERHGRRFAERVREIDASNDARKLKRLDEIRADAMVTLARAFEGGSVEDAVALSQSFGGFWAVRGLLDEGLATLERAVELARSADRMDRVAPLMRALGAILEWQGEFDRAGEVNAEALRSATAIGDEQTRSSLLADRASIAHNSGRYEDAYTFALEALSAGAACGNDSAAGQAAIVLGVLAASRGDADNGRRYAQEALERLEAAGHVPGVTRALGVLSMFASDRNEKLQLLERALGLSRDAGDQLTEGMLLQHIGDELFQRGELVEGLHRLQQGLRATRRSGNRLSALGCIEEIGCIAARLGNASLGVRLISAARTQRAGLTDAAWHTDMEVFDAALADARSLAGIAADEAWSDGTALTYDDACALAGTVAVPASLAQERT